MTLQLHKSIHELYGDLLVTRRGRRTTTMAKRENRTHAALRLKFRRNTHDDSGTPRDGLVDVPVAGLGVHGLHSAVAITFDQFVQSHYIYWRQLDCDEQPPPVSQLLKDLAALIDAGLAVVEESVVSEPLPKTSSPF